MALILRREQRVREAKSEYVVLWETWIIFESGDSRQMFPKSCLTTLTIILPFRLTGSFLILEEYVCKNQYPDFLRSISHPLELSPGMR